MSDRRREAFDAFLANGWTAAQSCGIVANLVAESALNHKAVGDGGLAFGIAQWHPPRQKDFAVHFGHDMAASSFDEQLQFVHYELTTTEKAAGNALRACMTAAQAGYVVSTQYERPADREGEGQKRAKAAEALYAEFAGAITATPSAPPSAPAAPKLEKKMPILALLSAFGPIIAQLIPQIATIMQPKGEVAKRNVELAQVAFDTITQAAGAVNVQEAVAKMQADPAVAATVTQAVLTQPTIMETLTIGAEHDKARTANREFMVATANDKWYTIIVRAMFNPVMIVTILTIPLVYIIVLRLVAFMDKVSADVIAQTIGTIIGLVLGGVMGFWMGQTYQQTRQRSNDQQTTEPVKS